MDDVRTSKHLSLVLRHRPDTVGLVLDPHGWVGVEVLLAALAAHGRVLSRDDLARIVAESDKQRFEWDRRGDRVRARQGHSVEVDLGLDPREPPPVLFHGTPRRALEAILAQGLDRRQRHHVHLSADPQVAAAVGARRGASVVLRVDAAGLHRDGHVFRCSTNGVWLVDTVPPSYLAVED